MQDSILYLLRYKGATRPLLPRLLLSLYVMFQAQHRAQHRDSVAMGRSQSLILASQFGFRPNFAVELSWLWLVFGRYEFVSSARRGLTVRVLRFLQWCFGAYLIIGYNIMSVDRNVSTQRSAPSTRIEMPYECLIEHLDPWRWVKYFTSKLRHSISHWRGGLYVRR